MQPNERKCGECGELLKGRIDKRFCDDQCRSAFNNRSKSDSNNYIRNVNNLLRKNRRILSSLLKESAVTVNRDTLLQMGFSFNYFTHIYTHNQRDFRFCYEFGYTRKKGNLLVIVRRPSYAD